MVNGPHPGDPRSGGGVHIDVDRVRFDYPEHPVLDEVTVAIERGDFLGIVGPNGSGKSTLLQVIDGLLRPASGAVLLDGRPVGSYPRRELARVVALVPQNFSLDFDFTVLEVVEMGHYCRQEGDARAVARQAMETLGIAGLADRLFPHLSGGEKQMVILAQALVQQPDVLLLDEPVSALDVAHQLEFFDCLRRLNGDGLTIACVLHDLNLALHYCRTLLMLSGGRAAACGPVADVLVPDTIDEVYGVHAHVHRHAGRSFLTFSPRLHVERRERVHLVCGGGTGATLMRELHQLGFAVSAGAVNALDSDEITGRDLGMPMAVEAPFSVISEEVHRENLELIDLAHLVVLTDVPIGGGNARNLDAVRHALRRGLPVWTVGDLPARDFTGGKADLDLHGVRSFESTADMLHELRQRSATPSAAGSGRSVDASS